MLSYVRPRTVSFDLVRLGAAASAAFVALCLYALSPPRAAFSPVRAEPMLTWSVQARHPWRASYLFRAVETHRGVQYTASLQGAPDDPAGPPPTLIEQRGQMTPSAFNALLQAVNARVDGLRPQRSPRDSNFAYGYELQGPQGTWEGEFSGYPGERYWNLAAFIMRHTVVGEVERGEERQAGLSGPATSPALLDRAFLLGTWDNYLSR